MSQLFLPSSPGDTRENDNLQIVPANPFSSDPLIPQFSFAAATAQVAHLADILASICPVDRHALMVISPQSVTFFAEHNHILNAQVAVDASLFSAYDYRYDNDASSTESTPKNVQLGVDVHMLYEAFAAAAATAVVKKPAKSAKNGPSNSAAYTDNVSCYIKYAGAGHPLVVEFEDRLMSEQIEFATFHLDLAYPETDSQEPEDISALSIDHSALRFEVILQSDILANLLQDLQSLSTEDLYIHVSNRPKTGPLNSLNFVSKGAIGFSKLVYPSARTMLQKLEIYEQDAVEPLPVTDSVVSTLAFPSFIKIFRAVKLSSKCKIMKDFHGVFSVQLLCKNTGSKSYPGTLIAFNMLEKSHIGGMGQAVDVDIDGLFDDSVYHQVREYEQGAGKGVVENTGEPFSYASFKIRERTDGRSGEGSGGSGGDARGEPAAKRRREGDSGGASEIPLFL